jgi:hypothetical protein
MRDSDNLVKKIDQKQAGGLFGHCVGKVNNVSPYLLSDRADK